MRHLGRICRGIARPFAPVLEDIWEMLATIASLVGQGLRAAKPRLATLGSYAVRLAWLAIAYVGLKVLLICLLVTVQEMHKSGALSTTTMAQDITGIMFGLLIIVLRIGYEAIQNFGDWFVDLYGEHKRQAAKREYAEVFSEYLQMSVMETIQTVIAKLRAEGEEIRLGLIARRLRELHAIGAERRALQVAASVLDLMYDCPLGDLFDLEVSKGKDPQQLIAWVLGQK